MLSAALKQIDCSMDILYAKPISNPICIEFFFACDNDVFG